MKPREDGMSERTKVQAFVGELLRRKGDVTPFADTDSLVLSGRLDSVEVIEVLDFLEGKLGVDFGRVGFDRDDFESVATMMALVDRSRLCA